VETRHKHIFFFFFHALVVDTSTCRVRCRALSLGLAVNASVRCRALSLGLAVNDSACSTDFCINRCATLLSFCTLITNFMFLQTVQHSCRWCFSVVQHEYKTLYDIVTWSLAVATYSPSVCYQLTTRSARTQYNGSETAPEEKDGLMGYVTARRTQGNVF
jgi:hypothetical protein